MNVTLPKIRTTRKKILGRGYGSGKGGHTVGRGQKGQKARRTVGVLFEGVKMKKSLIKRLPFRRGKNKFKSTSDKPIIINLEALNLLKSGATVNLESISKAGIVDKRDAQKYGVKILGNGELKIKLTIELPISNSAAKKVEKAGGEVLKANSNLEARNSKQSPSSK